MRVWRILAKGSLIVLILTLLTNSAFSAQKVVPGSTCKVYKQKVIILNKTYTCIKFGKKLVWGKGLIAKPTPTPSPTPSPTPNSNQQMLADFAKAAKTAQENSENYLPSLDSNQVVKISNAGSNVLPYFLQAKTPDKFKFLGPNPLIETDSSRLGAISLITKDQRAVYGSRAATPPWAVSFNFTTNDPQGRFVIVTSAENTQGRPRYFWRLAFKTNTGTWKYQSLSGTAHATDGKQYFDQVELGAPGLYSIHLEFESSTTFYGIGLSDQTNSIDPGNVAPTSRVVIVGDSWVYPVFDETGPVHAWDAFPGALSWLTGWNVISTGVGGQGYLSASAGETYRDRVVRDLIPQKPDVVIFTGSPNDHCQSCTFTDQQIANEMGEDIKLLKSANPNILIIVCSPFKGSPTQASAMKTVADLLGVAFINFIKLPLFDSINNGQNQLAGGHPTRIGSAFIAEQLLKSLSKLEN